MGRGQWGEGITGTTIKDTWRKSRARLEVWEGGGFSCGWLEGSGEKAYNSNWIIIKFSLKDRTVGKKEKRKLTTFIFVKEPPESCEN